MKTNIRNARVSDAEAILGIYAYYVKNTAISFEYDVPTLEEFRLRIQNTIKNYPYIVIEGDEKILGYAYAGAFKTRAAYSHSAETTIYVEHSLKKCGLGKLLYAALEEKLKVQGILNLYACISYPEVNDEYVTQNSAEFHEHWGYKKCGEFHNCGFKFGRFYNMIWMEKIIGEHSLESMQK